jgi:hypothetical protein
VRRPRSISSVIRSARPGTSARPPREAPVLRRGLDVRGPGRRDGFSAPCHLSAAPRPAKRFHCRHLRERPPRSSRTRGIRRRRPEAGGPGWPVDPRPVRRQTTSASVIAISFRMAWTTAAFTTSVDVQDLAQVGPLHALENLGGRRRGRSEVAQAASRARTVAPEHSRKSSKRLRCACHGRMRCSPTDGAAPEPRRPGPLSRQRGRVLDR